jgi:hypothetical protein
MSQQSAVADVQRSGLSSDEVELVLGGNAARLLRLE